MHRRSSAEGLAQSQHTTHLTCCQLAIHKKESPVYLLDCKSLSHTHLCVPQSP